MGQSWPQLRAWIVVVVAAIPSEEWVEMEAWRAVTPTSLPRKLTSAPCLKNTVDIYVFPLPTAMKKGANLPPAI